MSTYSIDDETTGQTFPQSRPAVVEEAGSERSAEAGQTTARKTGITLETTEVKPVMGMGPVPPDPRLFKYDTIRARMANIPFSVTRDDRMPAEEAGEMLDQIHQRFGVRRNIHADLRAFDNALFFSHTVNSGSTLQPGMARMIVNKDSVFDFGEIVRILGTHMRRFFRAYADHITEVNRTVLDSYNPYEPVSVEQHGWLMQVAFDRGLHRFPYLAHDSADACLKLNPAERVALAASKREVLSTTANSADSMRANPRTMTADRYNSTNSRPIDVV
jgi:hypothetical protein